MKKVAVALALFAASLCGGADAQQVSVSHLNMLGALVNAGAEVPHLVVLMALSPPRNRYVNGITQ